MVAPDRAELRQRLQYLAQHLSRGGQRRLERLAQQLDLLQRRVVHPAQRLQQQSQHMGHLRQRLYMARPKPEQHSWQQMELARRLQTAVHNLLERRGASLRSLELHLAHLDPQQVLARGYSVVRDEQGAIVMDSAGVPVGTRLDITFARGWASAELKEKGDTR
jgi:exodeoxyribonuclease VII large subunit